MIRRDVIRMLPLGGLLAAGRSWAACEAGSACAMNAEPLARQYSTKIRERLTWIRQNQTENLMEAAYAIAATVEKGGKCYQVGWDAGHTEADSWPGRNGEPDIFSTQFNADTAKKGDLLLTSGQSSSGDLKNKGIFIIGTPSPWSGDARFPELLTDDVRAMTLRPFADIFIENNATTLGGVINVPGMPAPIGPVSGIIGKTTIWMMLADACRILAKKGIVRKVKGDEPPLKGQVDWQSFSGWVDLNKPLMDDYFDEVMRQLDQLFAELGAIRHIASMAVDTVLAGGKIYGYSRYNSVAGEASTRRSGLAITQGVYGSSYATAADREKVPGTKNDCVIMGITKPDDEVDLAFLDLFRSRGMKVASIGPMTRSIAIPQGRTVPKETDLHAGRMCDTYGIFAIPGYDQRICPTSGVLLDHLWWTTMMEVVEQYIVRSGGDVPGAYFSAALKGGREHMYRMNAVYKDRVK